MLSVSRVLFWILCLAALSVGARNFEPGFSPDSPIYATIARNIVTTGDWFALDANLPDYHPYFADHPHLGFWLVAAVFKLLPAADWSARLVGHLFYVAFLSMLFFYVRSLTEERVAVMTVLLLWAWYIFANTFSSVMLDPGVLFFGSAAVFLFELSFRKETRGLALWAGICLASAFLYKGMAALGFLPTLFLVFLYYTAQRAHAGRLSTFVLSLFLPTAMILGAYLLLLRHSSAPEFMTIYFQRQLTQRLAADMSLARLFDWGFWKTLLRFTYFLTPLAVIPLFSWRRGIAVLVPAALASTFLFLLAVEALRAPHHYTMAMPWLAWLIADGALGRVPFSTARVVRATTFVAILAMFLIQYLPIRPHGAAPTHMQEELARLQQDKHLTQLVFDVPPSLASFIFAAPYAWYGKVKILYPRDTVPLADPRTAYFLHATNSNRESLLARQGWCPHTSYPDGSLWLDCSERASAFHYSTR